MLVQNKESSMVNHVEYDNAQRMMLCFEMKCFRWLLRASWSSRRQSVSALQKFGLSKNLLASANQQEINSPEERDKQIIQVAIVEHEREQDQELRG